MRNISEAERCYLAHHGIKGQKWGVRRYQNEDGTLTEAGKKHLAKDYQKNLNKIEGKQAMAVADYASYQIKRDYQNRRSDKLESKGKIEKSLKHREKANVLNKKMSEIYDDYVKNEAKLNDLLMKVKADTNVVWSTGMKEYYRNGSVSNFTNYYTSAYGTKFNVKRATDRRKSLKKYTKDSNKKLYGRAPIHTQYVVY